MKSTVILCCPTLKRELLAALEEAKSEAVVIFLPDGLHSDPRHLHKYVQDVIDSIQNAERIVVCPSGCGGGTIGLKATHCPIILPRTRDCIDILLSDANAKEIYRPKHGVFFTDSWAEYGKRSSIDLNTLIEKKGKEEAEDFLRKLYKGFEHFYIIDTGVYDMEPVREYLEPLRKVLDGQIDYIKGNYGVIRKIASGNFDEDFLLVPQGDEVPKSYFTINTDL